MTLLNSKQAGQMSVSSDLLDVNEAAHFLHLRPNTIRAWILAERLPVVRLGRRVFVRRTKLEELIRKSETPAIKHATRRGR